jgi:hypothetical protein
MNTEKIIGHKRIRISFKWVCYASQTGSRQVESWNLRVHRECKPYKCMLRSLIRGAALF